VGVPVWPLNTPLAAVNAQEVIVENDFFKLLKVQ